MKLRIDQPFTIDRIVRLLLQLAIFAGLLLLLRQLSAVLIPFATALLIAYLFNPFVIWLQKRLRLKGRVIPVLLTFFLIISIGVASFILLIPILFEELHQAGVLIAQFINDSRLTHSAIPTFIEEQLRSFLEKNDVEKFFDPQTLKDGLNYVLRGSWTIVSGSFSFLMAILSLFGIVVYLIFLLLDYDKVSDNWKRWLPPSYANQFEAVFSDLESSMRIYFRAQALIALINGVLFAIGFGIIGLPMGIFLGLFIGLLNMVPYLQWAGLPPALFFALIRALETGQNPWMLIAFVLVVFIVISMIEQLLLTPKIMGDATGLNPAFMLLALSVWGSLLGILGMLIALPLSTLLLSWYKRALSDQAIKIAEASSKNDPLESNIADASDTSVPDNDLNPE